MQAQGTGLSHFRHRHAMRYRILLLAATVLALLFLAAAWWLGDFHPFVRSLTGGFSVLFTGALLLLGQRKRMIAALLRERDPAIAERRFTELLEMDSERWHQSTPIRFITGGLLIGGWLLLMVADRDSRLAVILPSLFILLLLFSLLRNWLMFLDQLFLQDIIHYNRDHSSDNTAE